MNESFIPWNARPRYRERQSVFIELESYVKAGFFLFCNQN